MSSTEYHRLLAKAQQALIRYRSHPSPQSQLGLPGPCPNWLSAGVVLLYCGRVDSAGSLEPGISVPVQLRLASPTMHGSSAGAISQFMGVALRVGDHVSVRAVNAASGELAVLAQSGSGALSWVRFDLRLTRGATGMLTNIAGDGPRLGVDGVVQRPVRSVAVPELEAAVLPPSPDSSASYTDCAALAPVVRISDPVGDAAMPSAGGVVPGFGSIDIVGAALATRGQLVCLNITTLRPLTSGEEFSLELHSDNGAPQSGNRIGVFLAADRRVVSTSAPATPSDLPDGPAAGLIGVKGNRLSLLIDQRQFASRARLERFAWRIRSSETVTSSAIDCAPDASAAPGPGAAGATLSQVERRCS